MCDHYKKYKKYKNKSIKLEKELKILTKLISKINIQVNIENNPKNINLNRLVNIDPDYTQAYAGSDLVGGGTVV